MTNGSKNHQQGRREIASQPDFANVLKARLSRRAVLHGAAGTSAVVTMGAAGSLFSPPASAGAASAFDFEEVERIYDETHHVANGYSARILLRWGDPILAGHRTSIPTTRAGKRSPDSSGTTAISPPSCHCPSVPTIPNTPLVCHNEYPDPHISIPGWIGEAWASSPDLTAEQVDTLMAATVIRS